MIRAAGDPSATVEVKATPFPVDVKRLYLPVVVHSTCPTCGRKLSRDLDSDYLSYPAFNAPTDVSFCCEPDLDDDDAAPCSTLWNVTIKLGLTVEIVPSDAAGSGES